MSNFWQASIPFEFTVDASLEECFAKLGQYQHNHTFGKWFLKFPRIEVQGINDSSLFELRAWDANNFSSLDAKLEANVSNTRVAGHGHYRWGMLVAAALIPVFIALILFKSYHADISIIWYPIASFTMTWLYLLYSRWELKRKVQKILKTELREDA